MTKRVLSLVLVLIIALALPACGLALPAAPAETQNSAPAQHTEAPATPTPEPVETPTPEPEAVGYTRPAGADSVKTLLEKTMDYIRSDCDYSKIADVHDQQANMAFLLVIMVYESNFASETVTEITWEQAMERAQLLMGDAQTLRERDPELAERVKEWLNVQDPAEHINRVLGSLREQFRDGTINENSPNYEKLSQLLTDADKGTDYIMAHYPELFEDLRAHGVVFSLEEALEKLRDYADMDAEKGDLAHFKTLEAEYRPENSEPGRNGGIYDYTIGSVIEDHSTWSLSMLYYVDGETYYLVGYDYAVGGVGG